MTGYWPSSVFVCLRDRKKKSIKRTRPISSHFDRIRLVNKGFITRLSGNFCCRTRRVVPSGHDSFILPALVANHRAEYDSSCLLTELQSKTKVWTHLSKINAFYRLPSVFSKNIFFVNSQAPLSPFSMLKYASWTLSRGYNIEN